MTDAENMVLMPLPPRSMTPLRGFTLVELMIVVAIIGVMAALAVVGYRRYINAAGTGEAKSMIQGIRAGEEMYRQEMLVYLGPSATLDDYYPQTDKLPKDKKWNWVQPTDARYTDAVKGWQLLNVVSDAPVRFGYAAVAGIGVPAAAPVGFTAAPALATPAVGSPWFVVQAYNKRDNSPPVILVSSSMSGEIFVENEGN
ncbi:MAG: prepilin-type N-terminal cleavage/methylation domain-containing protein [Minicystis sp.]